MGHGHLELRFETGQEAIRQWLSHQIVAAMECVNCPESCQFETVADSLDGGPAARSTARDQCGDVVFMNSHETAMEVVKSVGRNSMMEIQQVLLGRMDKLCFDLGKQMREGFPAEADRRQEENKLRY